MSSYIKTSPSQAGTFQLCERRWFFGSILQLPQPQGADAAAGTEMHGQREAWQLFGTEPKHPSVALTKEWTPAPRTPGIYVEAKTTSPPLYIAGLLINGRIDHLDATDPTTPFVLDFKSKGNLEFLRSPNGEFSAKKIATVAKKLAEDWQLCIYGAYAFKKYSDATGVVLGHGYVSRSVEKPEAKLVITPSLSKEHIDTVISGVVPTFEAMKAASQAQKADELPANRDSCYAYGVQCPFYAQCPKPEQTFASMFGDESTTSTATLSLVESWRVGAGESSVPDPKEFVGTATSTAEEPSESSSLADELRALV